VPNSLALEKNFSKHSACDIKIDFRQKPSKSGDKLYKIVFFFTSTTKSPFQEDHKALKLATNVSRLDPIKNAKPEKRLLIVKYSTNHFSKKACLLQ
jgi:hypothetical protein